MSISCNTITYNIDGTWALNCNVLETCIFDGPHTAENIAESIKKVHDNENLQPSSILVTDNAANKIKAANILGWPSM